MSGHFEDEGVFIRSLATRGASGGLCRSAQDVAVVLGAWGAEAIVLETVGVGQAELDVAFVADTTLLVVNPGMGDDVQAIKAGLVEAADVFVVNKSDRPGADATVRDLEMMLSLLGESETQSWGHLVHGPSEGSNQVTSAASSSAWCPSILKTVASKGEGIDSLWAAMNQHRAWLGTLAGQVRSRHRLEQRLVTVLRDAVSHQMTHGLAGVLSDLAQRVLVGEVNPYQALDLLAESYRRAQP